MPPGAKKDSLQKVFRNLPVLKTFLPVVFNRTQIFLYVLINTEGRPVAQLGGPYIAYLHSRQVLNTRGGFNKI
jgi:hypothetical protein